MSEGVADNAFDADPILILGEENATIVAKPRVLVEVELAILLRVKTELPDESRVAENEEGTAAQVGEVGPLVGILLDHVFHESLGVSIATDVFLLYSKHS